ncbi:MAG: hypothetical protein M3352_01600, partial [Bacteroidota bacterium]|nr:hypothetical protein [Bacteroidota bacterium]
MKHFTTPFMVIVPAVALFLSSILFSSCKKGEIKPEEKTYSSEIVQTWINFDLRLLRANPTILNNFIMVQHWAYSSIALYEATLARRNSYQTLTGQLDQMPAMSAH